MLMATLMLLMPGMAYGASDIVAADAEGGSKILRLWESTGIYGLFNGWWQEGMMMLIGILLIYLGIAKKFEPLLLIPIGFGCILANIPFAGIADAATADQQAGFLYMIFEVGIKTGIFPLLIFMGVGAMTDFGPLLANPKTALLGAAAQLGIFTTLIGALWLSGTFESINFSIQDASAIGIIGGLTGRQRFSLQENWHPIC